MGSRTIHVAFAAMAAWGASSPSGNDQGQLGDGTVTARADFAQVGVANDWISQGPDFGCVDAGCDPK